MSISKNQIKLSDTPKFLKTNIQYQEENTKKDFNLLFLKEDFNGVIKLSKSLKKKYSKNSGLYLISGLAHFKNANIKLAIKDYKKSISLNPNNSTTYNNLGTAFILTNQFELALDNLEKAIEIQNFYPEAYYNLGLVYENLDDFENARTNYEIAIKQDPNYSKAITNLGTVMMASNKIDESIEYNLQAIKKDKNNKSYWNNLALTLKNHSPTSYTEDMANTYEELLDQNIPFDLTQLLASSLSMIKNHSIFFIKLEQLKINDYDLELKVTKGLSDITLFLKIMKMFPISDIQIEKLLTKIRRSMLLNLDLYKNEESVFNFLNALSSQCYLNEYIYKETPEETSKILEIENNLLLNDVHISLLDSFSLAILSSYRPLNKYKILADKPFGEQFYSIYEKQIKHFYDEKQFSKNVKSLTEIKDKHSIKLRKQNEENPYPRWEKCSYPISFNNLKDFKNNQNLKICLNDNKLLNNLNILIPGCGTGKKAIQTAMKFPNSKIIAFDLSKSSVAFAARKAKDIGVYNIDFQVGDILELQTLNRKFDIIECSGVLHQLEDPMKGLSILRSILEKNGLISLSLYSQYARSEFNIAKEVIKNSKLKDSTKDILKFRHYVIDVNDELLNPLMFRSENNKEINSSDFYSLSKFRDLIFQKKEQQFNIRQINELIKKNNFNFIGFDIEKTILDNFIDDFKHEKLYSLNHWNEFEKKNQNTFVGTYKIWLQKK